MNLSNGLLNLTNWLGNVIMPTMAGLFAAAAIYRFSKAHPYSHLGYAALASLMCSGLLRAMESFSNQASWNNPDRYWISVLTLVDWVGNVLQPRTVVAERSQPSSLASARRSSTDLGCSRMLGC